MRALVAAFSLLATLLVIPASAQAPQASSPKANSGRDVTYGELQNMRSLGVKIRFPDCKTSCERELIDASVTPAQFMQADSVDFVGERLLKIPDFIFAMKNLKYISLRNSSLSEDELLNLGETSKLEVLEIDRTLILAKVRGAGTDSAKVMNSITSKFIALRTLNISQTLISFSGEGSDPIATDSMFLAPEVAERLVYLKLSGSYNSLYCYPFQRLETLIGDPSASFSSCYDDAFTLPALKVLEGFQAAVLVRSRVKKRQGEPVKR